MSENLDHWRLIKNIAYGVVTGIVYYVVFTMVIPYLFSTMIPTGGHITVDPLYSVFLISIFTSLGVLSSTVKTPIGIIFEVLSAIIGLSLVLIIIGGGFMEVTVEEHGVTGVLVFRPIITLIAGVVILFTVIRVFEKLVKFEE